MTVAATTNRKTYTGDNVTTSFATSPVIFYATSDLQVRVTVISTGVSTLLTLNTHYTVSGGSAAGATGTVSLAGGSSPHGALLSTEKLVILRVLPLTQVSDFVNNNNSDAEVLEAALDKLTDVDQQIQEQADRSIRFASGDVSGSVTEIPDVTTRAGRLLGFDATGLLTTLIVQIGTSLIDLAASTGAALVGCIAAGAGAILRTLQSKSRDTISVFDYMSPAQIADVQGAHAQDHTASMLLAFTAAAGRILLLPGGTYNFNPSGGITSHACITQGEGIQKSVINITGNGDLFQRSSYSVLKDLTIDMNGGTYSGHACKIATGSLAQKDFNLDITDVANTKQAILFEADGGSGFASYGCAYFTNSAVGTAAAIKVNGNDSAAIPRKFYAVESGGCTLFDFGGAVDFFASGFYTNGLIFGANSAIVQLSNFRNGAAAGTLTINGAQHALFGISAAAMAVAASNCIIDVQTPSWAITETGTGNHIEIGVNAYTPVWDQASGTQPVLNNGTLTGSYSRQGDVCHVFIILTAGAATTFGNNAVAYRFSIPFPANSSFTHRALPCRVCDVSVPTDFTVWGSLGGGQAYVTLGYNNGAVRSDNPIAVPATGDAWQLSFSYVVG